MQSNPESVLEKAMVRMEAVLLNNGAILAAEVQRANEQIRTPESVLAKLSKEFEIRAAISESCAEWINSGRIPLMSPEDALLFHDRFFYGFAFAKLLSQTGFSWTNGEGELLRWFLIDSWDRITCLLWKHALEHPF